MSVMQKLPTRVAPTVMVETSKSVNSMLGVMITQVLPNIWIGDESASTSVKFFKQANITAVLNMTHDLENVFHGEAEYMRIPVYDSEQKRDVSHMYSYVPAMTEFIYKNAVLEKKNVLVHCLQGKQRSAAAVAVYMIKYYKMTPTQVIDFLLDKKKDVFHHGKSVNFSPVINKWYRKMEKIRKQTDTSNLSVCV